MNLQETHEETSIRSKSSGLWWPVYIGGVEHLFADAQPDMATYEQHLFVGALIT